MKINGTAYGRRAILEVTGNTLTWRAHRGLTPVAENIVTTIHDVRFASWIAIRHTWSGLAIGVLGGLWLATEGVLVGASGLGVGCALIGYRLVHPRRFLVLDVGASRLVMKVAGDSADAARVLAERIDQALMSGEVPTSPPMLP